MPEPQGQTLLHEIDQLAERVRATKIIDPKKEISDNLIPLMRMLAESTGAGMIQLAQAVESYGQHLADHAARLDDLEGGVAELAEASDSLIQPDLAAAIDEVLALGLQVCSAVEGALEAIDNDALPALVSRYRDSVADLRAEIDDVTIDGADDDDDNEDDSDSEPPKDAAQPPTMTKQ